MEEDVEMEKNKINKRPLNPHYKVYRRAQLILAGAWIMDSKEVGRLK